MARFQFAAVDSAGMLHDGKIDASGAEEARAKLERNGLKVRELTEIDPPVEPRPSRSEPSFERGPRNADRASDSPPPRREPRGSAPPARGFVLGLVALLISLVALGYALYHNPPWSPLARYNYSSAEAALRSDLLMEARGDVPAFMELNRRIDRRNMQERLATLEIVKTADYKGKKALFVKYKTTDKETKQQKERKDVEWYELDEGSGFWQRSYSGMEEVRRSDERLAREIEEWHRGDIKDVIDAKW
jgi:hypothetical protein